MATSASPASIWCAATLPFGLPWDQRPDEAFSLCYDWPVDRGDRDHGSPAGRALGRGVGPRGVRLREALRRRSRRTFSDGDPRDPEPHAPGLARTPRTAPRGRVGDGDDRAGRDFVRVRTRTHDPTRPGRRAISRHRGPRPSPARSRSTALLRRWSCRSWTDRRSCHRPDSSRALRSRRCPSRCGGRSGRTSWRASGPSRSTTAAFAGGTASQKAPITTGARSRPARMTPATAGRPRVPQLVLSWDDVSVRTESRATLRSDPEHVASGDRARGLRRRRADRRAALGADDRTRPAVAGRDQPRRAPPFEQAARAPCPG